MKFQPKRFVVEVKRGTSRASFASPDATADRFSDAEAALFGSAGKADAKPSPSIPAKADVPSGRILRSLVEPPPPAVDDPPPPSRRGRKPGSKNKPKPQLEVALPAEAVDRPRRGRKPGSKNKPKPQVAAAFPPADAAGQRGLAAAMRSYGFVDDGTTWTAADALPAPDAAPPPPAPAEAVAVGGEIGGVAEIEPAASKPARPRLRLRDRSSIIKRYVLDIEPRPGQPGAIRARRMARGV